MGTHWFRTRRNLEVRKALGKRPPNSCPLFMLRFMLRNRWHLRSRWK